MNQNLRDRIYDLLENIALELKNEGESFNTHIAKEYRALAKELNVENPDEKYWLAAVIGGTWAIGGLDKATLYIKQVFQITKNPERRTDKSIIRDAVYLKGYRGSRKIVMERMLSFHASILNKYSAEDILRNPVHYQKLIIKDAESVPYAGHWLATVPFKILAVSDVLPKKSINDLEPPLGINVVKGIKFITGYQVDPSRKRDRAFMIAIHRRLAEFADTDIFVINSGLWILGESVGD